MQRRRVIASMVIGLFIGPLWASAQIPGGMQIPGGAALPTGGFSKDALLAQAKSLVSDLTSMKDSGKLATEQVKQVDTLLPKANSLTSELAKPQVDAAKLPQMATDLNDLQKQVTALKGMMK